MMKVQWRPDHVLPFIQLSRRLVYVMIDGENYGWGIIVRYRCKAGAGTVGSVGWVALNAGGPDHIVDVLLACVDRHFNKMLPGAVKR